VQIISRLNSVLIAGEKNTGRGCLQLTVLPAGCGLTVRPCKVKTCGNFASHSSIFRLNFPFRLLQLVGKWSKCWQHTLCIDGDSNWYIRRGEFSLVNEHRDLPAAVVIDVARCYFPWIFTETNDSCLLFSVKISKSQTMIEGVHTNKH